MTKVRVLHLARILQISLYLSVIPILYIFLLPLYLQVCVKWKVIGVKTLHIVMQENHDIFIFTASSSDNTGTTVASVEFVILLLLILAALFVFYLKTKHNANASVDTSNESHVTCTGFGNELYGSGDAVSYLAVHVLLCVCVYV